MSFISVLLIALAMSTDAFAVAICRGISMQVPKLGDALKIGLLFGCVEAITPIIGWILGYIAEQYIEQYSQIAILILLSILGIRMIYNSCKKTSCEDLDDGYIKKSIPILILIAITTSIDSFTVGITLGLANINIFFAAIAIGVVTCTMVTFGFLLGKKIGRIGGQKTELFGGIVLIMMGMILYYSDLI